MTRVPLPAVASVAIPSLGALACCVAAWYSLAIVLALAALLLLCLVWLDYGPGSVPDPALTVIADPVRECRACAGAAAHCTCSRDCGKPRCAGGWVQAWEPALGAPHPRHPSGRAR